LTDPHPSHNALGCDARAPKHDLLGRMLQTSSYLSNCSEQGSPLPTELPAPFMRVCHEVKRYAARATGEAGFRAWAKTAEGRANARGLEALRGRYKGRRCFVMGNGPSLLKSDLNRLAPEVTIVSNAHYLIWEQLIYVPTFLAVEDRLVAEDRADDLRALCGITKVFPFDLRNALGPSGKETLYLNFPRKYRPFPQFSRDIAKQAYWGGTVSFLNLQLAAYLGCNPIVLLGFDHSYVVPKQEIKNYVIHSTSEDVNHIHPNYFGPGYRWHDPDVARMERAYMCARETLEPGVRILNATAGGHLEVFERVTLDEVLGQA
jgi:hypothetical protein